MRRKPASASPILHVGGFVYIGSLLGVFGWRRWRHSLADKPLDECSFLLLSSRSSLLDTHG